MTKKTLIKRTNFLSYEDAKSDGFIPCRCMGKEEDHPSDSRVPTVRIGLDRSQSSETSPHETAE